MAVAAMVTAALAACPSQSPGLQPVSIPAAGGDLHIAAGIRALWPANRSAVLKGLYIEAGAELIFPESRSSTVNVTAGFVSIRGSLTAGSSKCAVEGGLVFTLTDTITVSVPHMNPPSTSKVLLVYPGGAFRIYSTAAQKASWTRLSKRAPASATEVCLQEGNSLGWKSGDKVVLAPGGFAANETEYNTLKSPTSPACFTLEAPLRYSKAGGSPDPRLSSEVGLLSRNVVIQGAALDSACPFLLFGKPVPDPAEWKASCYGGHMVFLQNSTVELTGVEVTGMGQANILGRYPVHWHLAGPRFGSFIVNSSIHNNFQRCVTIHGTFGVTIDRVVCAATKGHGFFLEDAVEYGNTLTHNLAVDIVPGPLLCSDNHLGVESGQNVPPGAPPDKGPSGFWISNPNNTIRGNVAAAVGGPLHGFGFWFAMPPQVLEPSLSVLPSVPGVARWVTEQLPLKNGFALFEDNAVHSCYQGFQMDGFPQASNASMGLTCAAQGTGRYEGSAVFKRPVAWRNFRGMWLHGANMKVEDALVAGNGAGITLENILDGPGAKQSSRVVTGSSFSTTLPGQPEEGNAMCVHQNPVPIGQNCSKYHPRGFEILNGGLCLLNSSFEAPLVNHWNPTTFCPDSDPYYPAPSFVGDAEGDGNVVLLDNSSVTIDGRMLDLSLTSGTNNIVLYRSDDSSVVAPSGHLLDPTRCTPNVSSNAYLCNDTWFNTLQIVFDGVSGPVNWTWWRSDDPSWPTYWTRKIGAVDTRLSAADGSCLIGAATGLAAAAKQHGPTPAALQLQAWNTRPTQRIRGALWIVDGTTVQSCVVYSSVGAPADCTHGSTADVWAGGPDSPGMINTTGGFLYYSFPGTATTVALSLLFAPGGGEPPKPFSMVCPPMRTTEKPGWARALCQV